MADDPLDRFRRGADWERRPTEKPVAPATGTRAAYEAFATHDRATALDIIRAAEPGRCPSYAYLLDISYGVRFYTGFTLFFTFMAVKVRGENLKDVVDALRFRRCSVIREYHRDSFEPPPPGAPVIRKIEIIVQRLHESLAESEGPAEPSH